MEVEYERQPLNFHRRLLTENNTEQNISYGGGGGDESELDSDMVIILAFLLCALILTLGLNAFARRGSLNIFSSSSAAEAEAEAEATPGLKKRALRRLPVAVYGSGPEIWGNECPICLGEFMEGGRIRVLPKCGHAFHVGCIDTWLVSHASCPNCRVSLLPPSLPPPLPSSPLQLSLDISS